MLYNIPDDILCIIISYFCNSLEELINLSKIKDKTIRRCCYLPLSYTSIKFTLSSKKQYNFCVKLKHVKYLHLNGNYDIDNPSSAYILSRITKFKKLTSLIMCDNDFIEGNDFYSDFISIMLIQVAQISTLPHYH